MRSAAILQREICGRDSQPHCYAVHRPRVRLRPGPMRFRPPLSRDATHGPPTSSSWGRSATHVQVLSLSERPNGPSPGRGAAQRRPGPPGAAARGLDAGVAAALPRPASGPRDALIRAPKLGRPGLDRRRPGCLPGPGQWARCRECGPEPRGLQCGADAKGRKGEGGSAVRGAKLHRRDRTVTLRRRVCGKGRGSEPRWGGCCGCGASPPPLRTECGGAAGGTLDLADDAQPLDRCQRICILVMQKSFCSNTWISPMMRRPCLLVKATHTMRSRYLPGGRGGKGIRGVGRETDVKVQSRLRLGSGWSLYPMEFTSELLANQREPNEPN